MGRSIFMLLLCLLSICYCLCSAVLQYYISPDFIVINKTCALSNSSTVAPCYTLHELCDNQQLLLNKTSVEFLLLSGRHVISNRTFSAVGIEELEVCPWEEGEVVEIECVLQGRFIVTRVMNLRVNFLLFTGCFWTYNMNVCDNHTNTALVDEYSLTDVTESRVDITGCIFTQSLTTSLSILKEGFCGISLT